jgi:hypothetical protein
MTWRSLGDSNPCFRRERRRRQRLPSLLSAVSKRIVALNMRVSIAPRHVRPSANDRRIGIHVRTLEGCLGFTLLRPIDPASYPADPDISLRRKLGDQSAHRG